MRISSKIDDPDFTETPQLYDVYYNGKLEPRCIMADEENNKIEIVVSRDSFGLNWATETLRGDVKIVKRTPEKETSRGTNSRGPGGETTNADYSNWKGGPL